MDDTSSADSWNSWGPAPDPLTHPLEYVEWALRDESSSSDEEAGHPQDLLRHTAWLEALPNTYIPRWAHSLAGPHCMDKSMIDCCYLFVPVVIRVTLDLMHGCRDEYYKYPRNYKWYQRCVESVPGDAMYLRYFRVNRWVLYFDAQHQGREEVHAMQRTKLLLMRIKDTLLATFMYIVDLVRDHPLITRECHRTDFLTAEEQVACALRYFATGDTYESVGGLCGASRTSTHRAVLSFCMALYGHAGLWIRFPSTVDECKSIATDFERVGNWRTRGRGGMHTPGIPQVIGAMDGTQVPLLSKPDHTGDAYINRKGFPAINVSAVVNSRMRFMDVHVGRTGRSHDYSVLESTPLWEKLSDPSDSLTQLFENASVEIDGVDVPLQLLGDSAYPSKQYLLPAFRDSQAARSSLRKRFNDKHTTTRNVVERAFGVLKKRWRCLLTRMSLSIHNAT
eukprot:1144585-Pelagomonas_calceolata.AAC.1